MAADARIRGLFFLPDRVVLAPPLFPSRAPVGRGSRGGRVTRKAASVRAAPLRM